MIWDSTKLSSLRWSFAKVTPGSDLSFSFFLSEQFHLVSLSGIADGRFDISNKKTSPFLLSFFIKLFNQMHCLPWACLSPFCHLFLLWCYCLLARRRIYSRNIRFKTLICNVPGRSTKMDIWIAFRKINWSLTLVLQGEIMWHWLLSTVCSISILAKRHGWKCTHEVHWNRNEMGYYPSTWYFWGDGNEKRSLICAALIWL